MATSARCSSVRRVSRSASPSSREETLSASVDDRNSEATRASGMRSSLARAFIAAIAAAPIRPSSRRSAGATAGARRSRSERYSQTAWYDGK